MHRHSASHREFVQLSPDLVKKVRAGDLKPTWRGIGEPTSVLIMHSKHGRISAMCLEINNLSIIIACKKKGVAFASSCITCLDLVILSQLPACFRLVPMPAFCLYLAK